LTRETARAEPQWKQNERKTSCSQFMKSRVSSTCRSLGFTDGCANDLKNVCQLIGWENTGVSARPKYWHGSNLNAGTGMVPEFRFTLGRDIGKGREANHSKERKRMAHCQYQGGCLFIRGKKRKMWVARWREDVIQPDGAVLRVLRSETLGPVSEIAGRREARILLQNRLALVNSGQRRPEITMTFGNFVMERFEPDILPTLKYATQKSYSFLLRKHLFPRFRDCRLCEIKRADIQQFVIGKLKSGYAWETANHVRNVMSKVMSTAVSWNYLPDNPVRGVKMPERTYKRPHRFLDAQAVRLLIAASEEPVRSIVLLATMTGLRIGEILALRWGRVNLTQGTLRVEETCYYGHFGTPKTQASRREVPLPSTVVEALLAHRSRSRNTSVEALVFCTRQGMPLAPNNLRKRQLTSACERAGIARIDWHTLRHTHGTLLHEQGTPLKVAQAQLGHSRMTTTLEVYTHASTSAQRQAVNQLESQLFPSVPKFAEIGQRPN
jgi:integrase